MKLWFFSNKTYFEPVVGFETRFVIQVEDRIFPHLWKLTEVVPNKKISLNTIKFSVKDFSHTIKKEKTLTHSQTSCI